MKIFMVVVGVLVVVVGALYKVCIYDYYRAAIHR